MALKFTLKCHKPLDDDNITGGTPVGTILDVGASTGGDEGVVDLSGDEFDVATQIEVGNENNDLDGDVEDTLTFQNFTAANSINFTDGSADGESAVPVRYSVMRGVWNADTETYDEVSTDVVSTTNAPVSTIITYESTATGAPKQLILEDYDGLAVAPPQYHWR